MPATYVPIATTTLGANAATITFSSIAASYTDLRLVLVARNNRVGAGDQFALLRFNGDTATNYSYTQLLGNGTSVSGTYAADATILNGGLVARYGNAAGMFAFTTIDIFSYAGSTNKTLLISGSADLNGTGDVLNTVALWRNTSAITSITLSQSSTFQYLTGTTATLYGIKNA